MNTFLVITIGIRGLLVIAMIGAVIYYGWKFNKWLNRRNGLRGSKT